jgi:hypothetical protein
MHADRGSSRRCRPRRRGRQRLSPPGYRLRAAPPGPNPGAPPPPIPPAPAPPVPAAPVAPVPAPPASPARRRAVPARRRPPATPPALPRPTGAPSPPASPDRDRAAPRSAFRRCPAAAPASLVARRRARRHPAPTRHPPRLSSRRTSHAGGSRPSRRSRLTGISECVWLADAGGSTEQAPISRTRAPTPGATRPGIARSS